MFDEHNFKNVRIERIKPIDTSYEINTDTVWFEDRNIEECIKATEELRIDHIHLQTTTVDFLVDQRLRNIKGIRIQFEISNIEPLFHLTQLTHLSLPDNIKIEFNFSKFQHLIFLGGTLPKKYVNLHRLSELKYTYLFGYRKSDYSELYNCSELKKIWMYSVDVENLNGLQNLKKLEQLDLENCRKMVSLNGIGSDNVSLEKVHLANCKKLTNAEALALLPNLKQLRLYQISELDSLNFLHSLKTIEDVMMHPSKVGVQNNDYYPLVDTLKRLNKLEVLKGWKPLKEYLDKKVVIAAVADTQKSDLELIKANIGIMEWIEKKGNGLEQYSKKNCKKAEKIIIGLIDKLKVVNKDDSALKEKLIEQCVLELNEFNNRLDGSFIETEEREELCSLFDNIADAVGLNVQDYPDGIASKWRDW